MQVRPRHPPGPSHAANYRSRVDRVSGGDVNPDSFTHGTSDQRAKWFNAGREAGDAGACDTFSADEV